MNASIEAVEQEQTRNEQQEVKWADRLTTVPDAFTQKKIWVLWNQTPINGKVKIPHQTPSKRAMSNNPATWTTFQNACKLADANPDFGVGMMLDGSFTFIDLDHCRNAETGVAEPWAEKLIERLNGYTEVSPSGTGFHIFVDGIAPEPFKHNHVEIYTQSRYSTMTGDYVSGSFTPCSRETFDAIHAEYSGTKQPEPVKTGGLIIGGDCVTPEKMRAFLTLYEVECEEKADGRTWTLAECEFNPSHANHATVHIDQDGKPGYSCLHASTPNAEGKVCTDYHWKDYRDSLEARTGKKFSFLTGREVQSQEKVDPDSWRSLFHTYDETISAPPLKFAIQGFLQEDGITFVGGLAGHGKTYVMLNIVRALLEGGKLWDYFTVNEPSKRVLYLIPESGIGPFVHRLKTLKLLDYVRDGKLFYRTMSAQDSDAPLTDPRILKAAEGADVFLDTAIRFMNGDENSSSDNRKFAETLFTLQKAGARTVVGAHHSPKAFEHIEAISLENALRGSGDVCAMLATAWAVKQIDADSNRLYVKNIKPRDFEPCQPFELEGRPWIDKFGHFKMVTAPGMALCPKRVRKENPNIAHARSMRQEGKTHKQIAEALQVSVRAVEKWESQGRLREEDEAA